ncbi:MAG: 50S ribosomal protein L15 [Planctomycetes bacterium]|nr:50S ribosomal protein L15 [Planctomycetota bacterium]
MDLSTIHQGINRRQRKKRVGRGVGSGMGKTSTRGHKGQWASAGAKKPRMLHEGGQMPLFRRIPKRGFSNATWEKRFHIVNVGDLDQCFEDGAIVDEAALKAAGIVRGEAAGVRVLGDGELGKKLTVKAHHFSKSAAAKITAKGGAMEVIPPPKKPKKNKMKPRPAKEG